MTRAICMRLAEALAGALLAAALASCAWRPAVLQPSRPAGADAAKEALAHVERLRTVKPGADSKTAEQYNRLMEDAWKFFIANPQAALPVLREQLRLEIARPVRSDFMLLELGYYLHERGELADKSLARNALFALDPAAEILRWNRQGLFQFAHAVAADRDPRVLPLIDKAFLRNDIAFSAGDPVFRVEPTFACALLYGAYGEGAEAHLRRQLGDRIVARRIMEVLIWIGSPESNPEVRAAMAAVRDRDVFERGATFLMKAGGPEGRRMMLAVESWTLDPASQEYYAKIRKEVEATSFAQLRKLFVGVSGEASVAGDELKKRLAAMIKGDGIDRKTSHAAFLNSELPREYLVGELVRVRHRLFTRISVDALSAVRWTNETINALRYR